MNSEWEYFTLSMKTTIVPFGFRVSCSLLSSAALLGFLSLPAQAATFTSYAEAISGSYFLLPQRFVWVGDQPPAESESEILWRLLDRWRASGYQSGLSEIELFVEAYPNSAWVPSLHANLGKFYRD